tara:strand:- start:2595 stop:3293 length:699 start_codon:yes stop_codon:yes gene_type:complete
MSENMKKYVFLHNPKCAGTTMHGYLPNNDWHNLNAPLSIEKHFNTQMLTACLDDHQYGCKVHHFTLEQHKNMNIFEEDEFLSAWKFTFVRNPFDRLVSEYHYSYDTFLMDNPSFDGKNISFETFVERVEKVVNKRDYYKWYGPIQPNHVCPQHLYVYGDDDIVVTDYVGKVENFDNDVQKVFEVLGLQPPAEVSKINTTPKRNRYREYYNSETKKTVERIYEKDLNLFNYEF